MCPGAYACTLVLVCVLACIRRNELTLSNQQFDVVIVVVVAARCQLVGSQSSHYLKQPSHLQIVVLSLSNQMAAISLSLLPAFAGFFSQLRATSFSPVRVRDSLLKLSRRKLRHKSTRSARPAFTGRVAD